MAYNEIYYVFGRAQQIHTEITVLMNYITLPPSPRVFIYGVALTPEVQLIFSCLIFSFYYFAFLFDIKVRIFPPFLNFYALECVTNRQCAVFVIRDIL